MISVCQSALSASGFVNESQNACRPDPSATLISAATGIRTITLRYSVDRPSPSAPAPPKRKPERASRPPGCRTTGRRSAPRTCQLEEVGTPAFSSILITEPSGAVKKSLVTFVHPPRLSIVNVSIDGNVLVNCLATLGGTGR